MRREQKQKQHDNEEHQRSIIVGTGAEAAAAVVVTASSTCLNHRHQQQEEEEEEEEEAEAAASFSSSNLSITTADLPQQQQQQQQQPIFHNNNNHCNPIDSGRKRGSRRRRLRFAPHLSQSDLERGISEGRFHCGTLRVVVSSSTTTTTISSSTSTSTTTTTNRNTNRNRNTTRAFVSIPLSRLNNSSSSSSTTTTIIDAAASPASSGRGGRGEMVDVLLLLNNYKEQHGGGGGGGRRRRATSITAATNRALHGDRVVIVLLSSSSSTAAAVSFQPKQQQVESMMTMTNTMQVPTVTSNSGKSGKIDGEDDASSDNDNDDDYYYDDEEEESVDDSQSALFTNDDDDDENFDLNEHDDDDDDDDDDEGEDMEEEDYNDDDDEKMAESYQCNSDATATTTTATTSSTSRLSRPRLFGYVVGILESAHRKDHVGTLHSCRDFHHHNHLSQHCHHRVLPSDRFVLFQPLDLRFPRMLLSIADCPRLFLDDPIAHTTSDLVHVRMSNKWSVHSLLPTVRFKRMLGPADDVEVVTQSILIENGIDFGDFPSKLTKSLKANSSSASEWKIPKQELKKRRDLRKDRVFTIDPSDAKDLDDALSICILPNGQIEIRVHIADVSYFVDPNSPLDLEARSRSTSVYLSDRVIPMLPTVLAENLCSLHPGVDRLAFSIFWRMNRHGELLSAEPSWFGKTVIRSCAKLDYHIVQQIIDGSIKSEHQMPEAFRAAEKHSTNGLIQDVVALHKLAVKIRDARFRTGGALQLSRSKFKIRLDDLSHKATELEIYEQKDSNRLVEEFMLLANRLVAQQLVTHCGELALLRRHADPRMQTLQWIQELCNQQGLNLEIDTAEALHRSLQQLSNQITPLHGETESQHAAPDPRVVQTIQFLASKAMQTAQYFCSGDISCSNDWRHYALNIPFYTHFTSPIRRYTDIIVHRLLEWVIEQQQPPPLPAQQLKNARQSSRDRLRTAPSFIDHAQLTEICHSANQKKQNAKRAQEQSALFFLLDYLGSQSEPLLEQGVVCGLGKEHLRVFLPRLGMDVVVGLSEFHNQQAFSLFDIISVQLSHNNHNTVGRFEQQISAQLVLGI